MLELEATVFRLDTALEAEKANWTKLEQSNCETEDTILSLTAQLDGYKNIFQKIETQHSMESDDEEFNMTLEDELAGLDTDFTHIFAFDSESVSNSDS